MNLASQLFSFLSSTNSSASIEEKKIIGSLDQQVSDDGNFGKLLDEKASFFQEVEIEGPGDSEEILEENESNIDENFINTHQGIYLNEFLDNIALQDNVAKEVIVSDQLRNFRISDINIFGNIDKSSLNFGVKESSSSTLVNESQSGNDDDLGILNLSLEIKYSELGDVEDLTYFDSKQLISQVEEAGSVNNISDKVLAKNNDLILLSNPQGITNNIDKNNEDISFNDVSGAEMLTSFIKERGLKFFDIFVAKDNNEHLSLEDKNLEKKLILNKIIRSNNNTNSDQLIIGKTTLDKNYNNEVAMLSKWSNNISKNFNLDNKSLNTQKFSLEIKPSSNIEQNNIILNQVSSLKPDIRSSDKQNLLDIFSYSRDFMKRVKDNSTLENKILNKDGVKFSQANNDLEDYGIKFSKKEIELSKISLIQPEKQNKNNFNLIREITSPEMKFFSFKDEAVNLGRDNNISSPSSIGELRQNGQFGQQLIQNSELTLNSSKELQTHLHKQVINQLWKIGKIGQSRAILELEPKELGKVVVILEMNKGQDGLKVILQTETQQAAQILQQDVSKLRQLYAGFGIDLHDFHASKDTNSGHGKSYRDREMSNLDDKLDTKDSKVKIGVKEKNVVGKLDILA